MTMVAELLMAAGGVVAVLAGVGLLKFQSSFARFHAAGKASPVAFLVVALGASLHMGWTAAAYLSVAAVAMTITLPVGVHLLFRAVHRTETTSQLGVDDLRSAQARSNRPRT